MGNSIRNFHGSANISALFSAQLLCSFPRGMNKLYSCTGNRSIDIDVKVHASSATINSACLPCFHAQRREYVFSRCTGAKNPGNLPRELIDKVDLGAWRNWRSINLLAFKILATLVMENNSSTQCSDIQLFNAR
jgi:hypothetical protein